MGEVSRYWQFVGINAAGNRRIQAIAAAQSFFTAQFPDCTGEEVIDAPIQQKLLKIMRSDSIAASQISNLAETCLRCWISNQTDWICQDLVRQFGQTGSFSWADLYSLVLDDLSRRPATDSSYRSIARRILQTLNLDQGQLSTWTKRLVLGELNPFLLDCGIYLISDWALLNGTTPDRLRRLCDRTFQLPKTTTDRMVQLLTAYHAIYRRDRLQQRANSRSKCQPPTPEQLDQMVNYLAASDSTSRVLKELQSIAQLIRQARRPKQTSIDDPNNHALINDVNHAAFVDDSPLESIAENELLNRYRRDFFTCLEQSFEQALNQRRAEMNAEKFTDVFLPALCLFHCESLAMGKIAKTINRTQSTISRLLKLDQLRTNVRQTLLLKLRDRVRTLAATYTDQARLEAIDQELDSLLSEQIDPMIAEAEAEASTPNRPRKSLFSRQLCRYLKTQNIALCTPPSPVPIA